jgi:hypothetical protein
VERDRADNGFDKDHEIGWDNSGLRKLIEWAKFMRARLTENDGIGLDDDGPLQIERAARILASTARRRIRGPDKMAPISESRASQKGS